MGKSRLSLYQENPYFTRENIGIGSKNLEKNNRSGRGEWLIFYG
jgi:hypothetical protein